MIFSVGVDQLFVIDDIVGGLEKSIPSENKKIS